MPSTVPVASLLRKALTLRSFSRMNYVMLEEMGKRPRGNPAAVSRFSRAEKLTHEVTGKHDFDYPGRADVTNGGAFAVT